MIRVLRAGMAAGVAATVVLGLAGCAGGQIPGHGRIEAGVTVPAAGKSRPVPSKGGDSPAPTATVSGATATLGKATIPLAGVARTTRADNYLCLTLRQDRGCTLEIFDIGAVRRAGGSVSLPAPGRDQGWWWGSEVASCGSGSQASPVTASKVVEKGFRKVGPKTAAYGHWQVSCQNPGLDFDPRLWWLPNTMIAFRERSTAAGAGAAVDRILAGVTFGP